MTRHFGEAAAKLSSAASLLLGWCPDEFWNATPAELTLALQIPGESLEVPELEAIEELRRRFPDE